jgi:Fur family ferric uptake transcriptional regulator
MSPQEILSAARRRARTLGIATVYRSLAAMVDEGLLSVVPLPGAAPRYELAGQQHHHHFVCDTCDRVFDVQACPPNLSGLVPEGFGLTRHEIVLYGICPGCG